MEWSNENIIAFIESLQTEPCLWDPRHKSFRNRASQNDAWRRIIQLLPFKTSIEILKKKKESLIGYYRIHFNKIKKSLESGAGKDEVYTTSWFAYETMDSFLREVYERKRTLINDLSEEINYENENSCHFSSEIEEVSPQNIHGENTTRPGENKSQNYGRKRQLKYDLPPEIREVRRKIDEDFEYIKEEKNDSFLQEINDYSEEQERSEETNYGNENSPHLSLEIEEMSQNTTRSRENKSSQNYGRKRQRDDLLPEIRAVRCQMDEAFEYMKDDEYEIFGRLIVSKIKKIRNPNTRDELMNNIQNLVFRTCISDRLEQQSGQTKLSTSQSSHRHLLSTSPNPATYHLPPGPSTSQSPDPLKD